jgi:hypothetical protein
MEGTYGDWGPGPIHQSTAWAAPSRLRVEHVAKLCPSACLRTYSAHKPT